VNVRLSAPKRVVGVSVVVACALGAGIGSVAAASLPDGRAYELVSPAQKWGYQVGAPQIPINEMAPSPDGLRVSYRGGYPLEGSASGSTAGLLAERTGGGWVTASWLPAPGPNQYAPGSPSLDEALLGTNPDQTVGVYWDNTTDPYPSLWLVRADGSRTEILAMTSPPAFQEILPQGPGQPWFEGISTDGKHVVFADTDALVPGAVASNGPNCARSDAFGQPRDECENLYEWVDDGSGGGALELIHSSAGVHTELGGSAAHSISEDQGTEGLRHAISADGSHIFFQSPAPGKDLWSNPQGGGPLYVWRNGRTTEISAPAAGHSSATLVQYLDATPDGRLAFFWANSELTASAPTAGGIYRYDTQEQQLDFLAQTADTPPTAMASDDGSHLYFTDGTTLRVYANGGVHSLGNYVPTDPGRPGLHDDLCVSANVSPDGQVFVFTARDSGGIMQVYRYNAITADVRNLSQSTSGADFGGAGACIYPSSYRLQFRTRVMSDDGQYVFFDSGDALVPEDSNGALDAYEWHADANGGTVSLLSRGTNQYGSFASGVDASGDTAFLVTRDALVPQDGDDVYDIYAARIGGGFPLVPRASCDGDACQGASGAPLGIPAASTEQVSSSGNTPQSQRKTFVIGRPSARAKARFSRTGRLTITVRVSGPAEVAAKLSARLGERWVRSDRLVRSLRHAGRVRMTLVLSPHARVVLRRNGVLRTHIDVTCSGVRVSKRLSLVLRSVTSVAKRGGR
jgi:hypothetical protein